MSNGFLFWYERDWSPQRAADRITGLEAAGFSLAHAQTGRITELSSDDNNLGDRVEIDRATLLRRAAAETDDDFVFQYWIDLDTDMVCAIGRLGPDRAVQRLYLDGLTVDQQRFVSMVVLDQIRASGNSTYGLIIDQVGGSANEDWDAVVAGAPERVAVRPNVVGLLPAVAAKHPELHQGPGTRVGDLVIYNPDGFLPVKQQLVD